MINVWVVLEPSYSHEHTIIDSVESIIDECSDIDSIKSTFKDPEYVHDMFYSKEDAIKCANPLMEEHNAYTKEKLDTYEAELKALSDLPIKGRNKLVGEKAFIVTLYNNSLKVEEVTITKVTAKYVHFVSKEFNFYQKHEIEYVNPNKLVTPLHSWLSNRWMFTTEHFIKIHPLLISKIEADANNSRTNVQCELIKVNSDEDKMKSYLNDTVEGIKIAMSIM